MIAKSPPLLVNIADAPALLQSAADIAFIDLFETPDDEATLSRQIGAAVGGGAMTVVLHGVTSAADIQHVDVLLSVAEAEAGAPIKTGIVAIIGDNARGVLAGADYRGCSARLKALGWHGGRLTADLGSRPHSDLPATARHLTRLAAAAMDVIAVDWIAPEFAGPDLQEAFARAQRDGFDWIMIENAAQLDALRGST